MKKKTPIYEISIYYQCIIYDNTLKSLLSFINNDYLKMLLNEKEDGINNNNIRLYPDINKINDEIKNYLISENYPEKLIFVYDSDYEYNSEYMIVTEIFSGISLKVDKTLISIFEINKSQAHINMLKYNIEDINKIQMLMLKVQKQLENQKIIDFPIQRIKER